MREYEIHAIGVDCGIIEFLDDTLSIDYVKRRMAGRGGQGTLIEYFEANYGRRGSKQFETALKAYCYSLAGYSLVCYILQIKDRHNANIMLDQ